MRTLSASTGAPERGRLRLRQRRGEVGAGVGLGEDDERHRAALPGDQEEALQAARRERVVERVRDDDDVDVGRDDGRRARSRRACGARAACAARARRRCRPRRRGRASRRRRARRRAGPVGHAQVAACGAQAGMAAVDAHDARGRGWVDGRARRARRSGAHPRRAGQAPRADRSTRFSRRGDCGAPRACAVGSARAAERPGWLGRALTEVGHEPITPFAGAGVDGPTLRYRPSPHGTRGTHHRRRDAPLPLPARPAVPGRLGSRSRARTRTPRSCSSTPTPASTGYASGDHLPDREVLERFLVGLDPLRTEAVREICETVDFHGGRPWTVECAVWDLAGRLLDTPVWRLLGGRNERMLAYASSGELVDPDERARRARRAARARRARAQAALPPRRLARGRRRRRARARGRRRRLRADGGRQPGLAHGRRSRAALGRRHRRALRARAGAAGRLLARGAAALRRRRGLPRAAAADGHPHRRRRDGARRARGARPRAARRRRRAAARRRALRRHLGLPPPGRAGRPLRAHVQPAHVVERLRPRLQPAPHARRLDVPVRRGAVRPARPGRPSGATGCCRRSSRSRPTGRSRRRPARGSASRPTSTRSSAGGWHEGGRAARARRRARRGRRAGRRRRRARCSCASRPAASATPTCTSPTGASARGAGRWCSGTRARAPSRRSAQGVTHVAPGDRVVLCMIPSCGTCSACRAGRPTLCGPAGEAGVRGTLMDGTSRLALPDGTPLQHGLTVACFAERAVVAAAGVVPLTVDVPLWQAALLGCGAVTGIGAVRNVARPRIGERAAVIGCGGVGQQVIAGLVLAGASAIVAVDRDPAVLELALARGATHAVDARAGRPGRRRARADRRRRRARLRGRRAARDHAPRVGLPARGRHRRDRRASRPSASRPPSRPSSSSPTRASRAATTAAATRRSSSPRSCSSRPTGGSCWPTWSRT